MYMYMIHVELRLEIISLKIQRQNFAIVVNTCRLLFDITFNGVVKEVGT